jgi:pyridoxamine--pyruvate transaminase
MSAAGAGAGPVFTLATGPVGSTQATQAALARPVLHHTDPAFRELYAETVGLLREAFGTSCDPVVFPGEAVVGIEATAAAMIGPDDVVLNLVSGIYGRVFGQLARRFAGEVIEVETSNRSSIAPAAVSDALTGRGDVTIVSAVHCETPSGTMNDLDAIGQITARHGALLIIDAVSSFGGVRTDFENWPGVSIAAPQKALGGTPGLSLLHVSEDAWRHIAANPNAPRGSALSILDWRDAHRPDRAFPFTPPVSEIYALHSVLRQYLAEGPENVLERHRRAARAMRAGVQALGLNLWADEDAIRADTVTAIQMPSGVDEAQVRALARAESGVMLAGGQGELRGRVLQIGHMGPAAYPLSPVIALAALGRALRRLGAKADIGAAVEAALAAGDASAGDDGRGAVADGETDIGGSDKTESEPR